jgi:hypothetical protein
MNDSVRKVMIEHADKCAFGHYALYRQREDLLLITPGPA